jgi:hypothetical protein
LFSAVVLGGGFWISEPQEVRGLALDFPPRRQPSANAVDPRDQLALGALAVLHAQDFELVGLQPLARQGLAHLLVRVEAALVRVGALMVVEVVGEASSQQRGGVGVLAASQEPECEAG